MGNKQRDNIDQIRDLILGPKLQELQDNFSRFEKHLSQRDRALVQQTEAALEKIRRHVDRSLNALEARVDRLSETSTKERIKLKKMLHASDESLREMLDQHKQVITHRLKRLRKEVREENRKRTKALTRMEQEVQRFVSEQVRQLDEGKLAREEIAQMLLSAAIELQETDKQTLIEYTPNPEEKHAGKKNRKL
jgi:exonuclease VII large subunit